MSDSKALDPVTFEVLKNSFITSVDQMAEQMLRTCYSFVIYNRDFSNALHDAEGNSVAQGNDDIAVHVGTLHFTCKDVIRVFKGDMMPGDIYAINDPYAGGTHFSDVRLVRPIFDEDELIGFSQSNGHWSDLGGSVPGSFDVTAKDMFREAVRITPVRLFRAGDFCSDVANLIANNTRDPASIIGDIHSQAQATQVAEREILRLVRKYGREQVKQGMNEVQDYVERAVRQRIAALPDGTWKSVDYIDRDPSGGEGMIPIHIKMTIKGDQIHYDFEGSHPTIGSMYNSAPGATFSAVVAGMKTFFPDLPLNSGFYRMLPRNRNAEVGALDEGGTLQMLRARTPDTISDLQQAQPGATFDADWVIIDNPDQNPELLTAAPDSTAKIVGAGRSGPFLQGERQGGAAFLRLEGCYYHDGVVYFTDTAGGPAVSGSLWAYNLDASTLQLIYTSPGVEQSNHIDNVAVSDAGVIIACEDGGERPGGGARMLALAPERGAISVAENNIVLAAGNTLGMPAADYRAAEWAGAAFSADGNTLYANIQTPGITFAISGPWDQFS